MFLLINVFDIFEYALDSLKTSYFWKGAGMFGMFVDIFLTNRDEFTRF